MKRPLNAIITRLRQETGPLHARLDANPLLQELLSPRLSLAHYARVLEAFWGLYQPLEAQLLAFEDFASWGLELSERRKSPLLASDLDRLGRDCRYMRLYDRVPRVEGLAAAWGTLYVLEGSSLGAQLISRSLARSQIPENARQFFTSYGPRTEVMWQSFTAALSRWSAETLDAEQTFTAARATFQAFTDCLAAAEPNL